MNDYAILALTFLMITLGGCGTADRDEVPTGEELTAELAARLERGDEAAAAALLEQAANQRMRGDISVKGVVVDTDGQPVTDVQMSFRQVSISANMDESSGTSGERTVNGAFELGCSDCSAMEATFRKQGYESARHEWIAYGDTAIAPGVDEQRYVVTLAALPD